MPRHSSLLVLWACLAASAAASSACGAGELDSGSSSPGGDVELGGQDDRRRADGSDGDADADADGDGDAGDRGDDGGDAGGGNACQACGERSCGAQLAACMDNAECAALGDCGAVCNDQACFDTCEQDHPAGTADLYAYYDCLDTRCAADCGGADPEQGADPVDPEDGGAEDPGGGPVDPADPCQACVQDFCAGPDQACGDNAACVAIFDCTAGCAPEDEACYYACEDANPAGVDAYYELLDCVYFECPGECGL